MQLQGDRPLQRAIYLSLTRIVPRASGKMTLVTFAGMELVRDQLYLPKRNASVEEILLRQRQLATSFRYFASLGIAYTFGSRFANVVNPRFAGSVGGTAISQ